MGRTTVLRWIAIAVPVALLLAWWMWPRAQDVELAEARVAALVESIDEDGRMRAHDRYLVSAPVAGRVQRVTLHPGDPVERGAMLAQLEPMPLSVRERAETEARHRAALARSEQALQQAAALAARLQQADRDVSRLEQAGVDAAVARQTLDAARAEAAALRREHEAAEFSHRSAHAEAEAIAAVLALDGDAITVPLRSPVDAVVLRVPEHSARVVAGGETLIELGDPRRMEVVTDLLSSDAVRVRPGMEVELHDWGGDGVLRATVRIVEPSAYVKISPLGVEERRVDVIADLDDPPAELGDGYQLAARVVLWRGDALQVPATAVFRDGEGWSVFAIENGRVRQRAVRVGHRGRDAVEISQGLNAGDRVVRYPGDRVSEGMRVRAAD